MNRIRQLSADLVNKIAAGEVIERPASVVKELLENAVDAGSSRIEVDIEQGGAELIRVVDDGCGIHPDDLPLAFASHATSKLAVADDLFQVATLGFRGEALASVGAVAQVRLQSRPLDMTCGAEVTCHASELTPPRPWNGSPGTRIDVRHLFFNTPVRRKFLRTIATEMGHVCEAFTRIALARTDLHLVLRHNGKLVYEVPRTAGLRERIGLFFGADIREQLYSLEANQGPATLRGFITDPACERGNAKMQYLFLNGRCIRDRSLGHALQEAYRGLLMTGRYAVAFLFLDVPPDQVDVNVHPTKAEVRFRDSQVIYHLILSSIRERLRRENLTAKLRPVESWSPAAMPAPLRPLPPSGSYLPETMLNPHPPEPRPSNGYDDSDIVSSAFERPHTLLNRADAPLADAPSPTSLPATESPGKAIQLYDAYIVLETPEGMLVIDQHALHERILFEQFKERMRHGPLEAQRLLIPEPVDLPADQAARLLDHRTALAELGLSVEDFGGGTVLITSYPAVLDGRTPQSILMRVVDHLAAQERVPSREVFLNDILSLMACHAAVRAGDKLTPEAISALIAQKDLAHDTHHCPHGRPTSLLFSKQELDRQFRRI